MPPATPAAAVQWGTRPDERSVVTTLDRLAAAVAARGLGSPGIVIVGAVVGLAAAAAAARAQSGTRATASYTAPVGRSRLR